MGHYESSAKSKVHSTKCPHKENGKAHIHVLTAHLKALEQNQANSCRRSRRQEIIKLEAEINTIETKRTIQRIKETKSWFFEKINKIIN